MINKLVQIFLWYFDFFWGDTEKTSGTSLYKIHWRSVSHQMSQSDWAANLLIGRSDGIACIDSELV
ncbi:MAG: hypothetical protein U1C33_02895 [Candidatus Cloacimonadaceae bacterium]|nr:hypothetical protein [Candidatus Cloacimonadaceae bacterium]